MTKTELIGAIADSCGVSKRLAGDMVNCFVETVIKGVKKNGNVAIQGFGSFGVTARKARKGRNPRTGEVIQIAASKSPKFRAGKAFKEALK